MNSARGIQEQRLTVVPDELQAEMIRAMLHEHEIACVVRRTPLGEVQWGGLNPGMGGSREIVVRGADIEAARALLESPIDDMPHTMARVDVALEERGRLFGSVYAMSAVVLFGVPMAIWLAYTITDLLGLL